MTDFRTPNKRLLFKIETTSGTEETPAPASDAIKVENLAYSAPFDVDRTNEHRGTLDQSESIIGGGQAGFSGDIPLKGSGTGGTAAEWGALAQVAGLSETLLASAETGTAQAGADASITLAASGPSSTDDAYKGMIIDLTGGTGSGQKAVITAYNGTTKVATILADSADGDWTTNPSTDTTYSIRACAVYTPVSASLKTGTGFLYDMPAQGSNARLRKVIAAVASMSLTVPANRAARLRFDVRGIYAADPADVTAPTGFAYDSGVAPACINMVAMLGAEAVKFNECSLDLGNQITLADDPTATYGRDAAFIAARAVTGRINPRQTAAATRNVMADFRAGTKKSLWLEWGTVSGHRISLYIPQVKYTGGDPGDVGGLMVEDAPFEVVTAAGDDGLYLSVN